MKPDEKSVKGGAGKTAAVVVGAGVGAWAGAGIGIAGAFGAISGMLPLAALGAYAAHKLAGTKVAREIAAGARQGYTRESEQLKVARLALAAKRTRPVEITVLSRRKPKA